MSSNCLVFHTSGVISSSPAAFLFLIFLRTESSSSLVNGPSLMSNCILRILVIGSFVTFGGFPSRFSKCCFRSFILSCWFAAFTFALAVLFLLLTSFIVSKAILDCLSSTVKTASKRYRKNPTITNAPKLKKAQYQLAGIYLKEQTEYIQNQIDKIRDRYYNYCYYV